MANIYDLVRHNPKVMKILDLKDTDFLENKLNFVIQFNNRSDNADDPETLDCQNVFKDLDHVRELARNRLARISEETLEYMRIDIEDYAKRHHDGTENPVIIPYTDPSILTPIEFVDWEDKTCVYLPFVKIHDRLPIVDVPLFTSEFLGKFMDIWARIKID